MVICRPEPKNGKKGVTKLRDHEQAAKEEKMRVDWREYIVSTPDVLRGKPSQLQRR
jgi:hypothetical protein